MNFANLDFAAAILNVSLLWILTVPHEFAHAWVATMLGDDTPRMIALTGYGQEHDRMRSREAGFESHLVKPVDSQALFGSINP